MKLISPRLDGNRAIWGVTVLVIAVDAIWLRAAGYSADLASIGVLLWAVGSLVAVAVFYYRTRRADPIMRAANAAAQLVSFTAAAQALSYLVMTTHAPLVDASLATADQALGFEWHSWFAWVHAHPALQLMFAVAYTSLLYQLVACVLFLALAHTAEEFLEALIIAGLLTIAIAGLLPAIGNLPDAPHVPDLLALRAGTIQVIPIGRASQGLIAFPSFHAALAIIVTCSVRKNRWIFRAACLLNFVVVVSVLSDGGHYLVDLLGGVVIAGMSIWIVRGANRRALGLDLRRAASRAGG